MGKAPKTLADLLQPASVDEFLHNDFGHSFRYLPGDAGKFAALLTWPALNQILSLHQLDTPVTIPTLFVP